MAQRPTSGRRSLCAAAALALIVVTSSARAGDAVAAADLESFLGLSAGALDGIGGPAFSGSGLKTDITVAAGDVLSFSFNFLTDEDPAALGGNLVNDFAFITLAGADPTVLAEVATTSFTTSATPFAYESGLLSFSLTMQAAGTYSIGFGVVNVIDDTFPSGLLLDGFLLNGVALTGGSFEDGTLGPFQGIGGFGIVGASFGSPAADGRLQALVTTDVAPVPEPAALISLFVGASTCLAVAARRRSGPTPRG